MKKVVIAVSSGIAAFKVLDLITLLRKENIDVQVIMTDSATYMVNPKDFEKASGHKVYTTLFPKDFSYKKILETRVVDHIQVSEADLFVLAPATANTIGKLANGIADDFLTTTLLATKAPILLCPSMNTNMWFSPFFQTNLKKLLENNYLMIPPDSGDLACGYIGVGRLADIKKIAKEIFKLLENNTKLTGKKIMVTGGGTIEPIDAVRVIANRGSGKMGEAIAAESYKQGANVLLLKSVTAIESLYPVNEKVFETADELESLIKNNIKKYDVLFHSAAVSDFISDHVVGKKLDSKNLMILKLTPRKKILNQIKLWNPKIKLISFKAVYKETEKELLKKGSEQLQQSHSDYVVVNDVGKKDIGFGTDENEVYVLSAKGKVKKLPKASKHEIAFEILSSIQL